MKKDERNQRAKELLEVQTKRFLLDKAEEDFKHAYIRNQHGTYAYFLAYQKMGNGELLTDCTYGEMIAKSGKEVYERVVKYVQINHKALTWAPPFSTDFEFDFLGELTEENRGKIKARL